MRSRNGPGRVLDRDQRDQLAIDGHAHRRHVDDETAELDPLCLRADLAAGAPSLRADPREQLADWNGFET